jgi:hypothetical protein
MTPARNDSIPDNQNRADRGIRACLAERFSRFGQRYPHESFVASHR